MRAHLFVLPLVLVAILFPAAPAAGRAPSQELSQGSVAQGTASTMVVDRTVERPERAGSRLWVGAVVGVFGTVGLVLSRAFAPAGRNRGPDERLTA